MLNKVRESVIKITLKHLQGKHNQKLHGNKGGTAKLGVGESDRINIGNHQLWIKHYTDDSNRPIPIFLQNGKVPIMGFVGMDRKTAIKWGKMVASRLKKAGLKDAAYSAAIKLFGKDVIDKQIYDYSPPDGIEEQ